MKNNKMIILNFLWFLYEPFQPHAVCYKVVRHDAYLQTVVLLLGHLKRIELERDAWAPKLKKYLHETKKDIKP